VFVALDTQHAMRLAGLYCHLWPVRLYQVFTHYLINGTIFGKILLNNKMCFNVLYNICMKHFSL